MTTVFALGEFGQAFATRERGAELRAEVIRGCKSGDVVLDFAGVTNVSYSFADEFVGRLVAETGLTVRRENEAPRIRQIVERAVMRRAGSVVA